MTTAVLESGN